MRILIIIMLLSTTLVPNYLNAISHENYSEESFLFVGEDYMQENYKVTLHLSGVSVSTLFNEIQKQTKLDFVYNTELLETITPISVTAEKESVFDVLNRLFNGTGFIFKKSGNIITVNKKEELQQDDKFLVTGEVKDDTGEPLVGVTIQQKDTRNITITDMDGRYSIQVSSKAEAFLTFSFVGMKTKTVPVKGRVLNVKLVQDAISIDDVVVVGAYGTAQKRLDQVGSAFQVNADQLKALPALRVDKMLDGLIPGVKIDPNTDSPDNTRARYNVRVRGDASLSASNEPLWVVDGTPIYTGEHTNLIPGMSTTISPLSFINPDDIESITVLKDATATSIYGANGANGVILITTKKGKEGKVTLNYSGTVTFETLHDVTEMMSAAEWLDYARLAKYNAGSYASATPTYEADKAAFGSVTASWKNIEKAWVNGVYDPSLVGSYDWASHGKQTGITHEHTLSASGGSDKFQGYASFGYLDQKGTQPGQAYERYTLKTSFDVTPVNWFKMGSSINASYSTQDYGYSFSKSVTGSGDFYSALRSMIPWTVPYDENGEYVRYPSGDVNIINPIRELDYNTNQRRTFRASARL